MPEFLDFKLDDSKGYYDLIIDENGDFEKENSFDSAIIVSLTAERRADVTESPIPEKRRGWEGNEFMPVEFGSKLWLLEQERLTNQVLNQADVYAAQALQWLIDFNYLESIIVEADRSQRRTLGLNIDLFRFNGQIEHRYFEPWNNTGVQQREVG